MKYIYLIAVFCLLSSASGHAQTAKASREEYIQKYKDIAIKHMQEYGIPASITLAQGCFESDNGNSRLAVQGNNHFGIKCQKVWEGEKIYHDDDALQECFRKYSCAEESYADHANFLRYRDRYSFLFDLPSTDYKAWAYGLKKAGYATNPQYAERLIKIIEDNRLYQYDSETMVEVQPPSKLETDKEVEKPAKTSSSVAGARTNKVNLENYSFEIDRKEYNRNGVRFIKARSNDTYSSIAKEYNIDVKKLLSYNDVSHSNAKMEKDQVVFLESKKKRADAHHPIHITEAGEKLYDISQRYAVQLKALCKYNNRKSDENLAAGEEIYLREHRLK